MHNSQEHVQLCTAVGLWHTAKKAGKFISKIVLTKGMDFLSYPMQIHLHKKELYKLKLLKPLHPAKHRITLPIQTQSVKTPLLSWESTFCTKYQFSGVQTEPCYSDLVIIWIQLLSTFFFLTFHPAATSKQATTSPSGPILPCMFLFYMSVTSTSHLRACFR